jgi:hypothetical protein
VAERARWMTPHVFIGVALAAMAAGILGATVVHRVWLARRGATECRSLAEAHYLTNRARATAEDVSAGMTVTLYEGCLTSRRSAGK